MRKLIFLILAISYLTAGASLSHAQENAINYTLDPSEKQISIPVHLPYEGYGVNVLLKQNGTLVLNQSDVYYRWINNERFVEIEDLGFENGCPYNIQNPCNNLHATIHGLIPGPTTIKVEAYRQGEKIAETDIQVQVTDSQYTLEPSIKEIIMEKNSGYGVNVLLKKNGYLILDQQSIFYVWKVNDASIITVSDNGFENGCPYNISSPCPNLHATLYGVNTGKTQIEVEAWLRNTLLEVTYISVEVTTLKSPQPTSSPYQPSVSPAPREEQPSPYPIPSTNPNYEGERLSRLEKQIADLNQQVSQQQNLLQKIVNFLKGIFGF